MLGFHPISSTPFSALETVSHRIVLSANIPVEILATVHTIVEQIDIPIEIEVIKTDPLTLKWVLKSRGKQWVVDTETLQWILKNRNQQWVLDENLTKWTFNSQTMKWVIK